MSILEQHNLQPESVFRYFEEMAAGTGAVRKILEKYIGTEDRKAEEQ